MATERPGAFNPDLHQSDPVALSVFCRHLAALTSKPRGVRSSARAVGWPALEWNKAELAGQLAHLRHRQGRLLGRMDALGFPRPEEAALRTLTEDAMKSGKIEGEIHDKAQVRSAIARRLGIDIGALAPADRKSKASLR